MDDRKTPRIIRELNHKKEEDSSPIRVAAYCRVSTDHEDQQNSYATQIKYYTEYIGQHPDWVLADIYADEGISGTKTDKREDFKRLVNDCRRGKVDRVIVKSVSRFARNTCDCLALVRLLKEYGTSVYFEEQRIDTANLSNELMLTMNGMAAQGESMAISKNLRWSYKRRMEKGEFVGCSAPYGYRLADAGRTLTVYEPEAEVVRRIFDMYLSGLGKLAIANILNEEGIPRKHGRTKWHKDTINYILMNERYIGDALLQKQYTTEFPFRMLRNKGEVPQYYVENSHPAIISRETFETVNQLVASRKPEDIPMGQHILSGKLICPDCGHTFRRQVVNGIPYWVCCYKTCGITQNCRSIRYPEESVYDAFILMANKLESNRESILVPMIDQLEWLQNRFSATYTKIYEIDKEIAALNQQIHVFASHRTKGFIDAAGYAELSGPISKKISELRVKRRKLVSEDENDGILDDLKSLDAILADMDGVQTDINNELFNDIVVKIFTETNSSIRIRLIGGLELKENIEKEVRKDETEKHPIRLYREKRRASTASA